MYKCLYCFCVCAESKMHSISKIMTELATDPVFLGNSYCWQYFAKPQNTKYSLRDFNPWTKGKSILKYGLVFQGLLALHVAYPFILGSLLSWNLGTTFTCLPKLKLQSHLNISHRTALQEQELLDVKVVLWAPTASWNHSKSDQIAIMRGPAWFESPTFGCKPTKLLLHQFNVLCFKQKPLTQLDKPPMTEIFVKWQQLMKYLMLHKHRSHDVIFHHHQLTYEVTEITLCLCKISWINYHSVYSLLR